MEPTGKEFRDGIGIINLTNSIPKTTDGDFGIVSSSGKGSDEKQKFHTKVFDVDGDDMITAGNQEVVSKTEKRTQYSNNDKIDIEYEYIDVVWLKKDVRWRDHGPLSEVAGVRNGVSSFCNTEQNRKFVILYLYEPDQLREHSVHGSHLRFVHEGLVDMEGRLKETKESIPTKDSSPLQKSLVKNTDDDSITPSFEYLTVCHSTIISTLNAIHFRYPASISGPGQSKRTCYKIARLLAHEETGHWQSYMRDRSVRKWCKTRGIPFVEFNQNGVTRRLKLRDDYLKLWKAFMAKPLYPRIDLDTPRSRETFRSRLIQLNRLPGFLSSPRGISNLFDCDGDNFDPTKTDSGRNILEELPAIHRSDRPGRQQFGGETRATNTLNSFLSERGARYSQHISSPNTSWNSCSRLSVYLTWGHISLRCVLRSLEERREQLRKVQKTNKGSPWLKSLQAFASRAHWRSHFVQKLESEPTLEKQDLCPAYQHLRRQDGDFDLEKYTAWERGATGYPFVDACMRCLIKHGWINFRMRAMLVSFATYNLWLDWKKIAPHLARVFLDYEPGIHYPQLQMQAGTTGINAMRVYNVTKQGKDQDPKGIFIRKYVPELRNVPDQYIHEPWKMSEALKDKYYNNQASLFFKVPATIENADDYHPYPEPIVDEKESARIAKAKLNDVKKAIATRIQANQVYLKHGSRSRQSNEMNHRGSGSGALPAVVAIEAGVTGRERSEPGRQPKIKDAFFAAAANSAKKVQSGEIVDLTSQNTNRTAQKRFSTSSAFSVDRVGFVTPSKRLKAAPANATKSIQKNNNIIDLVRRQANTVASRTPVSSNNLSCNDKRSSKGSWSCTACTFLNEKPHGLVCSVCGTAR